MAVVDTSIIDYKQLEADFKTLGVSIKFSDNPQLNSLISDELAAFLQTGQLGTTINFPKALTDFITTTIINAFVTGIANNIASGQFDKIRINYNAGIAEYEAQWQLIPLIKQVFSDFDNAIEFIGEIRHNLTPNGATVTEVDRGTYNNYRSFYGSRSYFNNYNEFNTILKPVTLESQGFKVQPTGWQADHPNLYPTDASGLITISKPVFIEHIGHYMINFAKVAAMPQYKNISTNEFDSFVSAYKLMVLKHGIVKEAINSAPYNTFVSQFIQDTTGLYGQQMIKNIHDDIIDFQSGYSILKDTIKIMAERLRAKIPAQKMPQPNTQSVLKSGIFNSHSTSIALSRSIKVEKPPRQKHPSLWASLNAVFLKKV